MSRRYEREVYYRVSTDRIENTRKIQPMGPRLHDLGLHEDEYENCNIYGNRQRFNMEG